MVSIEICMEKRCSIIFLSFSLRHTDSNLIKGGGHNINIVKEL